MADTHWSQTYNGHAFYYDIDKLDQNEYLLDDIAHQLSMTNRYGGATVYPYSVAQHSVALAFAVWEATHDPVLALDALFHDAEEAYVGDMRLPLKDCCPEFRALSKHIDEALRRAMQAKGIPVPLKESPIVKALDRQIIVNERGFVMQPSKETWYAVQGMEPIPNLPPALFEQQSWRIAKRRWRNVVETYTMLAKMAEAI